MPRICNCILNVLIHIKDIAVHSHFLIAIIDNFRRDEDAAVTVDWVVLTAGLVTFAIAVVLTIQTSLETGATSISTGVPSAVSALLP